MKAIVLGVRGGRAALLLEDGTTTYRRMKCKPGQRVEIPDQTNSIQQFPVAAKIAAAAVFAFVIVGSGYYETMIPVSYVTMDVNPSIEYSLNRMDIVMNATALNEDAKNAAENISVNGKTISDAVLMTEEELDSEGYIEDDGYILLSVNSDSKKREVKIEAELSKTMDSLTENGVEYSILNVTKDERNTAKELSMSSGRYKMMLEDTTESEYDEKTISKYKTNSVKELMNKDDNTQNTGQIVNTVDTESTTDTNSDISSPSKGTDDKDVKTDNEPEPDADNKPSDNSSPDNEQPRENKKSPADNTHKNSGQPQVNNPANNNELPPADNSANNRQQPPAGNPANNNGQPAKNNTANDNGQPPANDTADNTAGDRELEQPLDNNDSGDRKANDQAKEGQSGDNPGDSGKGDRSEPPMDEHMNINDERGGAGGSDGPGGDGGPGGPGGGGPMHP